MADTKPKGKPGRKTRYRRALCDELPAMFENGESVAEVTRVLGVSRKTFYNWLDRYPEFREAYEEGLHRSEAWWMRLGRAGAAGQVRGVNPALWIFNMKNRFKWRDRPDDEAGPQDMTPEEFARKAAAALAKMEEADHGGSAADRGVDAA